MGSGSDDGRTGRAGRRGTAALHPADRTALVALLMDDGATAVRLTERLLHRRSVLGPLTDAASHRQADLFSPDPQTAAAAAMRRAEDAMTRWRDRGYRLVTVLDPGYPAQLRDVPQRPPVLFYQGSLQPSDIRSIAVVGTRSPSSQSLRQTREIATGLATAGVTVVSGLAAGVDTEAHHAALREGGRTVAVIGTGLAHSYPSQNRPLQQQLASEHLVLSQFWPDTPPTTKTFPLRNAVMSGYAMATVVVEAGPRSGARLHARLAHEQGRPLLLTRSMLRHEWARQYASRPGTTVIDNADDVLAFLADRQAADGPHPAEPC